MKKIIARVLLVGIVLLMTIITIVLPVIRAYHEFGIWGSVLTFLITVLSIWLVSIILKFIDKNA